MNKTYSRIFKFGKVDAEEKGKKNLVEIKVELKIEDKKAIFSASGNLWDSRHYDIIQGGQCIDSVYDEFKKQIENRKTYEAIMALWGKWHLNDLHAECIHQEKKGMTWKTNPSEKCKVCGWRLGHGWDYRAIDKNDLREIIDLLDIPSRERIDIIRLGK